MVHLLVETNMNILCKRDTVPKGGYNSTLYWDYTIPNTTLLTCHLAL